MEKTLVVFGGSGFVGKALCEQALQLGWKVKSISKHGRPSQEDLDWVDHPNMSWFAYNLFSQTNEWHSLLNEADVVVNLVGILFENRKKGLTYEKMIIESQRMIYESVQRVHLPFVYVSAKGGPPGYAKAKKEAEALMRQGDGPRWVIQSGLVVTNERTSLKWQGRLLTLLSHVPIMKQWVNFVFPTELDSLIQHILAACQSSMTGLTFIDLTQKKERN